MNNNQFFNDVVPPSRKRSIRDIPVPNRVNNSNEINIKEHKIDKYEREEFNDDDDDLNINTSYRNDDDDDDENNSKGIFKYLKYIIIVGVILVSLITLLIMNFFSSVTIKVTPKTSTNTISKTIEIEEISNKKNDDSLGYRLIELAQKSELQVNAEKEEKYQEKAKGTITIYNEYSKVSQKLIKNTRFEDKDGRIYRIQDSISVPGTKEVNGATVAGQIDAIVYADAVGENYNIETSNFTIPGFKGQEMYKSFYAKTKTPIKGGFDGIRKTIAEEQLKIAEDALKKDLKTKLINELKNQSTEEFYLIYNDSNFKFDPAEQTDQTVSNVKLNMKGYFSAIIFNKSDLSNKIAENVISKVTKEEKVSIENFKDIKIELISDGIGNKIKVDGEVKFVWDIDQEKLLNTVKGLKKSSINLISKNFVGITKTEFIFRPLWNKEVPMNIKDIKIEFIR